MKEGWPCHQAKVLLDRSDTAPLPRRTAQERPLTSVATRNRMAERRAGEMLFRLKASSELTPASVGGGAPAFRTPVSQSHGV